MLDKESIKDLIYSPSESFILELKDWIDPDFPEGKSKIIKASIAMRNNNGGYILIGFNNKDCNPNIKDAPNNVMELFHPDKIQSYITKYSSEPFEIFIHYPEIQEKKFVLIEIPSGVKTPVATKASLSENGKDYFKDNKVYVRTLNSNNTVSTTEATWRDWSNLIEKCFDNREADIGRFIRRHFSSFSSSSEIKDIILSISNFNNQPKEEDRIKEFLKLSKARYDLLIEERQIKLPLHGTMEVAAIINGKINEFSTNEHFLNLIRMNNLRYISRPAWYVNYTNESTKPFVNENAFEALILFLEKNLLNYLQFWRINPKGEFYLIRALRDDTDSYSNEKREPMTVLDFGLVIRQLAECIAVIINYAKALGCEIDASILFLFKWSNLSNRLLTSWANPERDIGFEYKAYQNEITIVEKIPFDTPPSAISGYVHKISSKVFQLFNGMEFSEKVTDEIVRETLNRTRNF